MPEAHALAEQWQEEFRRASILEDGDPEGLIEHLRDLSEQAGPDSTAREAFAIFLTQIRAQDLDPVLDDDDQDDVGEAIPGIGLT